MGERRENMCQCSADLIHRADGGKMGELVKRGMDIRDSIRKEVPRGESETNGREGVGEENLREN